MDQSRALTDSAPVPADLPEDMHASYKPRSVIPIPSLESDSSSALRQKMDSQQLALWRTAYGDGHASSPPSVDAPPADSAQRPAIVLHRLIGKGGFGEVWEATQSSLGRVIAVKRMKEDLFSDTVVSDSTAQQVELSFRQEALTSANLDHPNIVPLHDLGRDEKGRAMLSMKLVRGRPWDAVIEEDRSQLDPVSFLSKHLQILIQMAQAVGFAHSRGIVHRDLKPGQVMVGDFGEVLLMDWGLAVVYDKEKARIDGSTFLDSGLAPTLDVATNPAGTIVYMAPEQTDRTAERIGPWTDVYLLGGTLYTLLTNTVPHKGSGNVAAFYKAMSGNVEPPSRRAPKAYIPEELEELCGWAMHPDIDKRLSCARTFIREVQSYLNGASRRSEALELLEQAEELYLSAVSYESYGRAAMTVERAGKLWPENGQIFELQQRIVVSFAEMALRNEDLILARIQSQRIADTETRDRITARVDRMEAEAHDANRKKNFFRRVSLLSVVVMILSLGVHYAFVVSAREELETANSKLKGSLTDLASKEREVARSNEALEKLNAESLAARARAEELVSFLAMDLSTELSNLGRTRLIERVAQPLVQYYREMGPDAVEDTHSQRNRVNALLLEAMLDRLNSRPTEALGKLAEAEERIAQLVVGDPLNPEYMSLLARLKDNEAKARELAGETDGALAAASSAVEASEVASSSTGGQPESQLLLAESYRLQGYLLFLSGQADAAGLPYDNAEEIYRKLLADSQQQADSNPFHQRATIGLAQLLTYRSLRQWEIGDAKLGYELTQKAAVLRMEALKREPWNLTIREAQSEGNLYAALMAYDIGDFERAREDLRSAKIAADEVARMDGSTIRREIEGGYTSALLALVEWRRRNVAEALRLADDAVQQVATPPGQPPTPALELAQALIFTIQGLVCSEKSAQGRHALEKAVAIYGRRIGPLESAASHHVHWYGVALVLTQDAKAPEVLRFLSERKVRRREIYEAALRAGFVEPSDDFSLKIKSPAPK